MEYTKEDLIFNIEYKKGFIRNKIGKIAKIINIINNNKIIVITISFLTLLIISDLTLINIFLDKVVNL